MTQKLLYIFNRCFWPPMGGHEVEVYHYCRGLHEEMGYTIDVFLFEDEKKVDIENKPYFINDVLIAEPIRITEKIKNIACRSLVGKNAWPIQCSLYYSTPNEIKLRELSTKEYDVFFVDMIRLAPYYYAIKNAKAKKILDIDDALSKRYRRQLASLNEKTIIAGQYNERLPLWIQNILKYTTIKRAVLKFEIPRMEKAETVFSNLYDNVVFVSSVETEEFNKKIGSEKAVTIAMGVDYKYFSESIDVKRERGVASFVANMKTAANADSVRMIINDILPYSKKLKKVLFIGNCPDVLKHEFEANNRVEFVGRVDDLREYAKKGDLFLSPLAYGTGIKTKILEAMAMGIPVVTNSIGAEGIPGINGTHWMVSDDCRQLGEYIDYIIDNPQESKILAENAQNLIKDEFQWECIFKQFRKLGI